MSKEGRYIILTHKTLEQIVKFAKSVKDDNVVVTDLPCGGIGDVVYVTTQCNFYNKDGALQDDSYIDVSDYDSW